LSEEGIPTQIIADTLDIGGKRTVQRILCGAFHELHLMLYPDD
jgi:hypothetical protein